MKNKLNELKNRIKENFKKNKVLLIVFSIIWVVIIALTINHYGNTFGKESIGNESYDRSVIELNENTTVSALIPVENESDSVSVLFATYARSTNKGDITISIIGNNTGKEYANKTVNVKDIEDNAYYTVKLNEKLLKTNDLKIRINISSNSEEGKGAAVYYSNEKGFERSSLIINNEKIEDSDLMIRYLKYSEKFNNFSIGIISFSIIIITLLAYLLLLISPKPETLFAISVFLLGIIFMIIIVPMSPPDEQTHYETALGISNEMLLINNGDIDSAYLKYGSMYGHYNISAGYARFIKEIFKPVKLTGVIEKLSMDFDDMYKMQYLPISIGITIGRLLNCNMITTIYIGRLVNLLMYTFCVYFAIKKITSYKYLIGILAIMPMFLQVSISLTCDCFINSLAILTLSYYIKLSTTDEKITVKEYVALFIICTLLAPAKVVYSFLIFLFFLIPNDRFNNKKQKFLLITLLCIPAAYKLFDIMKAPLLSIIKKVLIDNRIINIINAETNTEFVETGHSFNYIFSHPFEVLNVFYRTIRYRIKFWFYGSLGRELSGGTLILPIKLVHSLVITILLASIVKQNKNISTINKVFNIVVCILIGLYIMVGMYVAWTGVIESELVTDYGGYIVEGIQGRYFCPIIGYFLVIFANKKFGLPEKTNKYIYLGYLFVMFEVIIYVLSYTFVN